MRISFSCQLREDGGSLRDAVVEGTLTRLSPKLMTALVASLGFLPMADATVKAGPRKSRVLEMEGLNPKFPLDLNVCTGCGKAEHACICNE